MLVVSRGRNDKVVFPTLGISVEILRVAGNKVRLGIEAPREIPVHRHEVFEKIESKGEVRTIKFPVSSDRIAREMSHATRTRLNAAAAGLHSLHRQVEIGDLTDAESTIFQIFNELKAIEGELDASTRKTSGLSCIPVASHDHGLHHRALIVEDDDNERELLAGCLRLTGFEVDTAADGLQAMVRLTEKAPDVVLLDMRMPRFDGPKTIRAIRSNPSYRELKLFAVSGAGPEDLDVKMGPDGVDRWFIKPVDAKAIMDALQEELHIERVLA